LTASHQADNSTLDSLEEIEIRSFKGTDDHVEFLKLLLSKCSPTKLINVEINISYIYEPYLDLPAPIEEVVDKVRAICHPNLKVRVHITSNNGISEIVL
jgi:hypothetical protein